MLTLVFRSSSLGSALSYCADGRGLTPDEVNFFNHHGFGGHNISLTFNSSHFFYFPPLFTFDNERSDL
jgi:hypothetical protein